MPMEVLIYENREDRATVIVLLCAGDKKTQWQDIVKAKEYWRDFKERYHGKEN